MRLSSRFMLGFLALALFTMWLSPSTRAAAEDASDIKSFLNQTILWYRELPAQQQLVSEPSDVLFLNDNRRLSDQVVKLSFDFARGRAQALESQKPGNSNAQQAPTPGQNQGGAEGARYRNLVDRAAKTEQQAKGLRQELVNFREQLATAKGKKRTVLEATVDETEAELSLVEAHREAIQNMMKFMGSAANGTSQGGLAAEIEQLARTVPPAATATANTNQESAEAATSNHDSTSMALTTAALDRKEEGIFVLSSELFGLKRKLSLLDETLLQTEDLAKAATNLRAPLTTNLRDMGKRGDDLMGQPDSQDPVVLGQQKKELDGLTAQFKQVSSSVLPLGKQSVLLDLYKQNTLNWKNAVQARYAVTFKELWFRLGLLGLSLGVVLAFSAVARRITFRYVQDARRRHQFLLLRRIMVSFIVSIIVIIAAISGLESVTTFAGLLTAGVAVALQNVILAVAGYFFLIGKFGVRVGDRIQISGVTGDVTDIGLMRLHLVEVGGGLGPRATGRVVAFSNAVVFQPGGFFKQIPGTSFVWHEVALTIPLDSDYARAESRMLEAVNGIFGQYREKMETQHRNMEKAVTAMSISSLRPESRLRLLENGVQVVIRYPVEMESAAEIDDKVTRAVLEAEAGLNPQQPRP